MKAKLKDSQEKLQTAKAKIKVCCIFCFNFLLIALGNISDNYNCEVVIIVTIFQEGESKNQVRKSEGEESLSREKFNEIQEKVS